MQALGLTEAEVLALQLQGFVSSERRGKKSLIYKLRFRMEGRQRIRYLGTNLSTAEVIKSVLSELQQVRRLKTQMRIASSDATKALRETKRQLEPLIEPHGFKFHGRAIRRSRQPLTNLHLTH